jgi:hypothetical protein
MITLQTITTIELSSICNLSCKYCINRLLVKDPERKPGIMKDEIFDMALFWLQALVMRGTQKEVNLNGNGESCLDPKLCERIRRVKKIMGPGRQVGMCTNGANMTPDLARDLKASGIDRVDLSPHSPWHARRAVSMMSDAGIKGIINWGSIVMSHNWAGQLEPENAIECRLQNPCDPLIQGRGYILSEGNVTPCCYDFRNLGVFGHVLDNDLLSREIRPYELCGTCHQVIPPGIKD